MSVDLGGRLRDARGEQVLLQREVPLQREPLYRRTARRDRRPRDLRAGLDALLLLGAVPLLPALVLFAALRRVVAGDGGGEAVLEVAPPELAVGHDGETDALLVRDDLPYQFLLQRGHLLGSGVAVVEARVHVEQRLRPAEAADVVYAEQVQFSHE